MRRFFLLIFVAGFMAALPSLAREEEGREVLLKKESVAGPGATANEDLPSAEEKEKLIHRIFRKRILDFDRIAIQSLGFTPLDCFLYDTSAVAKAAEAATGERAKPIFESKSLNSCLLAAILSETRNAENRREIVGKIELSGAPFNDRQRKVRLNWRPVQLGDPDAGFWSKVTRISPLVSGVNLYSLSARFLAAYLSNDLYVEFDRPVRLRDFGTVLWAEQLIVGDVDQAYFTRLEIHTAQMEPDSTNPYTMRALAVGKDASGRKVFALGLKMNWGIFNQSKYEMELDNH